MKKDFEIPMFYRIGNNLSVDFVNTRIADNGEAIDLLTTLADFAAWAAAMDLLAKDEAKKLQENWQERRDIEQNFASVVEFREVLYQMIEGIERGNIIKPQAIAAINVGLRNQIGFAEIESSEEGFAKRFRADYSEPRQLLAPIAESAADLLCYGNLDLLKKCESENCVLHFYDTTKNHSRRWCAMAHCGNRAKANAFYKRKKAQIKAQA